MRRLVLLVLLAACASAAACSPHTLRVTAIQVGRSLNADNTVATSAASFSPNDKIYVSVLTTGIGSGTISVRWTLGGRVLEESKKDVSYKDFAATDFSIQSPSGFPQGQYTVEAFLDGQSAGSKTFRVD